MIDWSSLVATVLTLSLTLGQWELAKRPVLAPWSGIGSSAYVWIVNPSSDSLEVTASAPMIDSTIRSLGKVPPGDSLILRLPYADTKVYLTLGGMALGTVEPNRPGLYSVSH